MLVTSFVRLDYGLSDVEGLVYGVVHGVSVRAMLMRYFFGRILYCYGIMFWVLGRQAESLSFLR